MESKSSKIKSLRICQTAYLVVGGGYVFLGAEIMSNSGIENSAIAGIGCFATAAVICGMSYGTQKQINHISKK